MKKNSLLIMILAAVLFAGTFGKSAQGKGCGKFFWDLLFPLRYPTKLYYPEAGYRDPSVKNVLVLSDGPDYGWGRTAAEKLALLFPGLQVTRTDLAIQHDTQTGNLTVLHMDNTKPFPEGFRRKFDRIEMPGGMCFHGGGISCGGIPGNKEGILTYFSRIFESLNDQNPTSRAFLGADEGKISASQLKILSEAGRELESQTGGAAKVTIVMGQDKNNQLRSNIFLGVEITRNK